MAHIKNSEAIIDPIVLRKKYPRLPLVRSVTCLNRSSWMSEFRELRWFDYQLIDQSALTVAPHIPLSHCWRLVVILHSLSPIQALGASCLCPYSAVDVFSKSLLNKLECLRAFQLEMHCIELLQFSISYGCESLANSPDYNCHATQNKAHTDLWPCQ